MWTAFQLGVLRHHGEIRRESKDGPVVGEMTIVQR
jgi:hypothetical protein